MDCPRFIQPTTFAEISGNKSERTKQFYAYMKKMKKCGCKAKRYSDWRKKA